MRQIMKTAEDNYTDISNIFKIKKQTKESGSKKINEGQKGY